MEYPSKNIKEAVEELASLPGIGRKTALRLALHILKLSEEDAARLGTVHHRLASQYSFLQELP